jgi:hypothetical protein
VFSADAFVLKEQRCEIEVYGDIAGWAIGGADSKLVSWDQAADWGESGTDEVPDRVALQAQYSCSAANLPWWDVAAAFSLTELRIYRIHRDPEIEAMLLEAVEDFWVNHVLARVPPRPGASDATASALKRMFPRSTEPLRCATDAEWPLIESLRAAKQEAARAKRVLDEAKAQVIYAIGDSEGLLAGADRITYRRSKDSVGVKWEAVARELGLRLELVKPLVERALLDEAIRRSDSGRALVKADSGPLVGSMPGWWKDPWEAVVKEHTGVVKEGSRRLLTPRDWAGED